ncbi:hypothetical protein FNV43_RR01023 [Rhamnella rubrinervis]|uniref:Uncharacterized protein n=1 Tax=Rhamnella rubrinervis TaxID=2594499 RepID=A0A8K0HRQ8_9ROSA|nr:hypothetical protein FNV43_RR01023 [Rhamnella rubrinervis]
MRGYQTPQRELARASGPANHKSKKFQKISKKSLSAAFTSASADFPVEDLKESVDFSPISEVSDVSMNGKVTESLILVPDPALSASSDTLLLPDITPSSEVTSEEDEQDLVSLNHGGFNVVDGSKYGSLEAEIVVNVLRQARAEVLNFANMESRSKKLLDTLIEIVIEDLQTVSPERDRFAELLSGKTRTAFWCFFFWIFVVAVTLFFSSGTQGSSGRLFPT